MSGTIQKGKVLVGVAKQSAQGVPAASAAYAHALSGGKPVSVDIEQEPLEVTSGSRERSGAMRKGVAPSFGAITFPAYVRSIGLYLLGAFGSVVNAGVAGAYTHTYAPGDALPYLTAWSLFDTEYQQLSDVKVGEFGLSWEGHDPLEASVTGPACAIDPNLAAAWDLPSGEDDESASDAVLIPTGGVFKIAAAGDAPATAIITGGEVKVTNDLESVPNSASLLPGLQAEKMVAIETSLKVVPEDLALWRTILTGSPSGTTVQETVAYGSFELEFKEYGAGGGKLNLRAHRVAFLCDFPDADPAGGYAELDMAGVCFKDASHAGVVPVLTNEVELY